MPDHVNQQITDAVTQANVKVLADAPAMAMGSIYESLAEGFNLISKNAIGQQEFAQVLHQSTTNAGVQQLMSVTTATDAEAVVNILFTNLPNFMAALGEVVKLVKSS